MKILIFILTALSFSAYSQDTILSQKLDSLIWIKINTYRTSISEKPCTSFETTTMRKYSKKITERNSFVKIGFHSDSVGITCNGECLFQLVATGNSPSVKKMLDDVLSGNFEYLAQQAVQNWINSSSHEAILSYPTWTVSTVTSKAVVSKDKTSMRFDCSYHCRSADSKVTNKKGGATYK
jgi:hypothetical protein